MNATNKNEGKIRPTKLSDLYEIARNNRKKRVVVAVAQDEHCLEAVCAVVKLGLIDATLVGASVKIKAIADQFKLDLSGFTIVNEENDLAAVKRAVKMVHDKEGDILMKGNITSAHFLRGVLDKECGLRKSDVLSHFALFEVPTYHKLLGVTDAAMVIAPDLKTKVAIINNSVEFMNKIGITRPKVAVLGAVEMVNEAMPATLDAALLAKMGQRGQIKNCIIDGPLAYDNAISMESAKHKGIVSDVAGDADLLVVPDIEAGNILYKAYGFSANAKLAATILGAAAPIILTSRSETEESKQASIVMAAAIN
ncbi:MAG TPA: bifunctional enoyl-CoA hydratase/phosphate acetyltransferase [Bacteroidales bacterium]|nr:bifunctional enoyl-CoA hydratase/phosphate acetyltransferase [Bacteroidales bacterium]HPS73498.1 bifunctional enoyl-CoA hydratase/phosphate acetyltransferase [Bacteroidales bacterium]